MPNVLFISETTLKDQSLISDNVDIKYLRTAILFCQDTHVHKLLGTALFNELKTQITANTVTAPNATLLADYIQNILVWRVTVEASYWSANKLMNKGVMNQNSENSQPVSMTAINAMRNQATDKAQWYEQRLIDFMCENSATYPLYDNAGNGVDDIQPHRGSSFTCAIYLGEPNATPVSMRKKYRDEQINLN